MAKSIALAAHFVRIEYASKIVDPSSGEEAWHKDGVVNIGLDSVSVTSLTKRARAVAMWHLVTTNDMVQEVLVEVGVMVNDCKLSVAHTQTRQRAAIAIRMWRRLPHANDILYKRGFE